MAYHLDHLYISPAQFGISQQLASDNKLVLVNPPNLYDPADYYCRPSGQCFEVPFSWNYGGPSAGHHHFSTPVHCGNLWDSDNLLHRSYLQLTDQTTVISDPYCPYPPSADAGSGVQEDGFSYLETLEARSVSLVGRQLAVRVYNEAQLVMQEVRKTDLKQLIINHVLLLCNLHVLC